MRIIHRFTPWSSPPLSTALCATPTLRLPNERNPLTAPAATSRWHVPSTGDSRWRQSFPAFYSCCAGSLVSGPHSCQKHQPSPPLSQREDPGLCGCWREPSLERSRLSVASKPISYVTKDPNRMKTRSAQTVEQGRPKKEARRNTHGEVASACPLSLQEASPSLFLLPLDFCLFTLSLFPALSQNPNPTISLSYTSPVVLHLGGSLLHLLLIRCWLTVTSQAEEQSGNSGPPANVLPLPTKFLWPSSARHCLN